MDVKQLLKKFVKYQIEWLTMHDDIEFEPEDEQLIIKFLKDTMKCFMLENKELPPVNPAEKVEQCEPCTDAISREAAIKAICRHCTPEKPERCPTAEICHSYQELKALPPVQIKPDK